MLRLAGYRGFVLVDYDGSEEPETAVPRSARYMRAALQTLARRELLMPPDADVHAGNGAGVYDASATVEATTRP
jgi:hypothetical protein